jgi:hypothetical protein
MGAPIRVTIVDDVAADRQELAALLNGVSGVEAFETGPPENMDSGPILIQKPDAVIIDYQLNAREAGRPTASYKGSTFAAVLREKLPNHPILLVTREQLQSAGRAAPARDVAGAFDEIVIKSAITKEPKEFGNSLIRLVEGFRALEGAQKNWSALRNLLGAATEEAAVLLAAEPPEAVLRDDKWRVPEVARWIRSTLLKYPGVFYDSLHASAALGIDRKSYLRPSVRRYLRAAGYRGPFAPSDADPVVWKGRLLNRARKLLRETGREDAPLTDFAAAWRERHRGKLSPAVCVWSRLRPADNVCYLLQKPVMRRYSVTYRPDSRPASMDTARVSFRAIRGHREYDERLVTPDARRLARKVERAVTDGDVPS